MKRTIIAVISMVLILFAFSACRPTVVGIPVDPTPGTDNPGTPVTPAPDTSVKDVNSYDGLRAALIDPEVKTINLTSDLTLDPDEIVRRDGKEALLKLLEKEVTWMEFYLQYEKSRTNLSSYLEKKEFIEKVQSEFSTLDDTDRRYFTEQLSEITGIRLEFIPQSTRVRERAMRPVRTSIVQGITQAEDQILIMMMKSPSAARIFEDELGYLIDPVHQRASVLILEKIHRNGKVDVVSLLDETEDHEVNSLLTSLVSSPYYNLCFVT